jgi:6-phosphofructo-2-kinase
LFPYSNSGNKNRRHDDNNKNRSSGDRKRIGSFEDIIDEGDNDEKRRSTSSFFQDESEDGDPKGLESGASHSYRMNDNDKLQLSNLTNPEIFQPGMHHGGNGNGGGNMFHRMESPGPIREGGTWTSLGLEQPCVVAMVGLPARGKSYIANMIIRFLGWSGFECQVFNVGKHRRKIGLASADSNFFDNSDESSARIREEMAMHVQNEMYKWLHESMSKRRVAFFDATNTTVERRLALAERARSENTFLLFVESICDDEATLQRNYTLKLLNDDYKGMDVNKAREDFLRRVEMYQQVYETIVDTEDNGALSYIKMINVGQKMITRNCSGYLPSQISFYLQNVHIHPRKIFLSLTSLNRQGGSDEATFSMHHGESANLTNEGKVYSRSLALFCEKQRDTIAECADLLVLSGASRVHAETLFHLRMLFSCYSTPLLNEMRGGDLHGLSRAEIKKKYPQEYLNRSRNKLYYRFPGVGGESYLDIIERVRPVIIELERQRRSVLTVCHVAVLRCIYAYLMGTKLEDVPYLQFKSHHVYELTPGPFGTSCVVHDLSAGGFTGGNMTKPWA